MTAIEHSPSYTAAPKASGPTLIVLGVLAVIAALICAAFVWGPAVLTMAALALVPVMFVFFVLISRP